MLFGDIRLLYTDRQQFEGNFGLGYRQITSNQRILGGYAFFDIKDTASNNTFYQGSFGAEFLDINWGLRANGYVPNLGPQRAAGANAFVQGNQILIQGNQERAYYGMDIEAEHVLWRSNCPTKYLSACDIEIWGSAGYFYFDNDAAGFQEVAGPRARVEARLYDLPVLGNDSRLVAGAQYEHDDVRGSVTNGFVNVRIPFGPGGCRTHSPKLNLLDRRMVTPIVRDIDVVTTIAQAGPVELGMNAKTGTVLDDVVTLTNADDILAAIEGGPDNRTFILDGVNGPELLTNDIDLNDGQILIGGGGSMNVVGVTTGMQAIFTAQGDAFTFDQTIGGQDIITLGSNNGIYGLTLLGGQDSIAGTNPGTFEIAGNTFMNAGQSFIEITGTGGVMNGCIVGNNFSGSGGNAIDVNTLFGPEIELSIRNNSFDAVGGNGVNINTIGSTILNASIDNNSFNGIEGNGIDLNTFLDSIVNAQITNNEFIGNGNTSTGVSVFTGNDSNLTLLVDNNLFDNLNDNAIEIDSDNVLFFFGSNAILNASITNNTILGRGNTLDGIDIFISDDSSLTSVISNNLFDEVVNNAIIIGANDDAMLTNVEIVQNNIQGRGLTNNGIQINTEDRVFMELVVQSNLFDGVGGDVFVFDAINDSVTNLTLTGNQILGRLASTSALAITVDDDSVLNAVISNNFFNGLSNDVIHIDGFDDSVLNLTIGGNQFSANNQANIVIHAEDDTDLDALITNNSMTSGTFGIDIFSNNSPPNFVTITGNNISNITDTGIRVDANNTLDLGVAGANNSVNAATIFDIDNDGDVIGVIRINNVDEIFP